MIELNLSAHEVTLNPTDVKTHGSVCRVTKKAGARHIVSILSGRKKTAFSRVHKLHGPFSKGHHFCIIRSCPPDRVGHTANLIKFATAICEIWVFKVSFIFFLCCTGASIYFHTLCKNCYKTQACNSIASIFGTNEECIKMSSCNKFAEYQRSYEH